MRTGYSRGKSGSLVFPSLEELSTVCGDPHSQTTFHAKMGSIKDRNGMDITEAEDIKKMWQEYTEIVGGAWGWCTVMPV